MEVASGSMILHPDLANELRALHESSGFETAGSFLKHLFALEEQHRSQQNLSTDLERLNDFTTNQAISLATAQPPKTASIGVQAKLCSCSDKVIVKTLRGGSAVRKFGLIQRGDLSDKTFDPEGVDQSDLDGDDQSDSDGVDQSDSDGVDQSDSDGVDQSGSDYSDTEETEEEVNYNGRKRKQKSKTVKGKPKHKTVPKKKKQRKDNKESATVSQPNTKRRKPDEGTESVSKPKKKTKKSKDRAKTDGKQTKNEDQPNQYVKKHSEEISAPLQYQRFVNVDCIEARPYACDLCDKAFRLERSLMIHANIHKHGRQLRYFHCTQCDKGYTNGASLKEHIRTYHEHHGEKLNKCSYCDKCFVRKNALRQHIKIKHKTPEKARSVSF